MKKQRIIAIAVAAIILVALVFVPIPKRLEDTIAVASITGETVEVDVDVLIFSSLALPSYVKGTLAIDGIEYTDQYTKLKEFPYVSDNRLFPASWWKTEEPVPCNMTFLKSDCSDVNSALLNQIKVLDIVFDHGVCKIHYMYMDESNQIGTQIEGISFWGPAQNAEEAKQIAKSLGYQIP